MVFENKDTNMQAGIQVKQSNTSSVLSSETNANTEMARDNDATKPGLEVIKLFLCSTQLSMKFIILINVKMPTHVGILTFVSMINTTSASLKARKVFLFQHFSLHERLKFHAQLC